VCLLPNARGGQRSHLEGGETASLYALPQGEAFARKTLRPACGTEYASAACSVMLAPSFADRC